MAEGGNTDLVDAIKDIQEQSGNHDLVYSCEEVEIGFVCLSFSRSVGVLRGRVGKNV